MGDRTPQIGTGTRSAEVIPALKGDLIGFSSLARELQLCPGTPRAPVGHSPIIEAARPRQQQCRYWHPALILVGCEAAGEVYEEDQEEGDVPGGRGSLG